MCIRDSKRIKAELEIGKPIISEVEKLKDGLSMRSVFRLDKLKEPAVV